MERRPDLAIFEKDITQGGKAKQLRAQGYTQRGTGRVRGNLQRGAAARLRGTGTPPKVFEHLFASLENRGTAPVKLSDVDHKAKSMEHR